MRTVATKVMKVGRFASAVFGVALVLALVLGAATMALAAVPGDPFKLGRLNTIDAISRLKGSVAGPMFVVVNDSSESNSTALRLQVEPNRPPMTLNSDTRVTNLNADELDGQSAAEFVSYERTVVVSPVGSAQQNGTALLEALGGIEGATEENPYLLYIEPGTYDLGTQSLQMKSHVDIEGSGELATTITSSVNDCERGVVVGANDAEIRFLTVDHNNASGCATGIANVSASPRITSVSITVLDEAGFRVGVWNEHSSPVMTDVRISVTGPNGIGVQNRGDSSPTIRNSIIETQIGIFNQFPNGDPTVRVDGSRIEGSAATIQSTAGSTVRVGASQLAGGNVDPPGNGTVTCAGVYDENYTFFADTCPGED